MQRIINYVNWYNNTYIPSLPKTVTNEDGEKANCTYTELTIEQVSNYLAQHEANILKYEAENGINP